VKWAAENEGKVTGLIIPNVFGAFGKPFYNSFIATFCHQLTHNETPAIANDGEVKLIYVQELVSRIIDEIRSEQATQNFSLSLQQQRKFRKYWLCWKNTDPNIWRMARFLL